MKMEQLNKREFPKDKSRVIEPKVTRKQRWQMRLARIRASILQKEQKKSVVGVTKKDDGHCTVASVVF